MIEILPGNNILIGGKPHSVHYHDGRFCIVQNTDDRPGGPLIGDDPHEPPLEQHPGNAGAKCRFHLYRVIDHHPGEELGTLIASYPNLNAAIMRAGREQ